MKPVFPYPTLFGDVDLEVVEVSVDGDALPYANVSKTERTVALHRAGRDRWDVATLRLRATLPAQELAGGENWSQVTCLAVLTEKATNARVTAVLADVGDGIWTGTVDLSRSRHLTRATLAINVVGTVDGLPGRLIGASDQDWFIDLKAATPLRQREIEIVEADFRDGPNDWLRPYKEAPWVVETTGDIPTVYLNTTGVEGLIEVLNGVGSTAQERLLKELTASQIAQDAWTAMFHTAVSDLDVDEDGTPVMPAGWREPVLRMMLPDVLPGRQLTDALYDINERRTKGFGWSELQTSVQYAAGRRSRLAKKLTNAVRSVDRVAENENR